MLKHAFDANFVYLLWNRFASIVSSLLSFTIQTRIVCFILEICANIRVYCCQAFSKKNAFFAVQFCITLISDQIIVVKIIIAVIQWVKYIHSILKYAHVKHINSIFFFISSNWFGCVMCVTKSLLIYSEYTYFIYIIYRNYWRQHTHTRMPDRNRMSIKCGNHKSTLKKRRSQ